MAKLVKKNGKTFIRKGNRSFRVNSYGRLSVWRKFGKKIEELSSEELDELVDN